MLHNKGMTLIDCTAVMRRTAHPSRCPTDSSVGPLSIPGGRGAPGLLTAPQLLQQRQPPPAAPPRDGCRPINWTVDRPACKHTVCVCVCEAHTDNKVKVKMMIFFWWKFWVLFAFFRKRLKHKLSDGLKVVDTHMCWAGSSLLYSSVRTFLHMLQFSLSCLQDVA